MAIKGKGKTKGRAPAGAPRRTPVDVPVPFFLRRRVQVLLGFEKPLVAMVQEDVKKLIDGEGGIALVAMWHFFVRK
jgi:hypothetical protein